jgi:hypothetical protein
MPGILVAVGGISIERMRAATKKLAHVPTHESSVDTISSELAIGWAGPPGRVESHAWTADPGKEVYVWRFGHSFKGGGQPAPIGAPGILRDYMSAGVAACFEYEGSFVIVIADKRDNRLYVVPDRVCSQPLYYTRHGEQVVIGPEVKALAAVTGVTPSFSTEGVVGFLCAGYNIGAQTLFRGIERLEVGKMLEITLRGPRQMSVPRFWKLDFSSRDKLVHRREAEDALFQAIKDAHRVLLADKPAFQILLSGGADSRGMLGACSVLGTLPDKAVTWGLFEDVPRSDVSISKALAARFGIPWDFIYTQTDNFVENCEQWAYVSELSNDNFGWYAEGFGTLLYLQERGFACSFIGDESWGVQGFAYNEMHAYGLVLTPNVPASLLALMPANRHDAASASYLDNIRAIMRDCEDEDWTDRKDFLYLHARVARFIFALGYNRGHVTEHRRPFLTRGVLDVVRRLPAEFRVYKNLYRSMLKRHLPETMRVPYATVSSLPDWNHDLRAKERLRRHFLGLLHDPLIATGALGGVIETAQFRVLRDAYFAQTPTPVLRRTPASKVLKMQVREVVWRQPLYRYVDRWRNARSQGGPLQRAKAEPVDILRRVAILVLLERQLSRFTVG